MGELGRPKVLLMGDETGELRSSLVFFFLRKPSDGILCEVLLIAPRPAAVVEQSRLRLRVLIYHNDVGKREMCRYEVGRDDNSELKAGAGAELCETEKSKSARWCSQLTRAATN